MQIYRKDTARKMKNHRRIISALIIVAMLLIVSSVTHAKSGHIKLLAVSGDDTNSTSGKVVDLYLNAVRGSGRIFMETLPLTKLDVQLSTRFANEIACKYIDFDCSLYDFFYTIKADSVIVGGPSAGAAVAIITIAALEGLPIDQSKSITATINSGGVVGPVGGIKAKLEAAARNNITTVLVAEGERIREGNKSIDAREYAKSLGVALIEINELSESLEHISGKKPSKEDSEISVSEEYLDVMKSVSRRICDRNKDLIEGTEIFPELNMSDPFYTVGKNLSLSAEAAFRKGSYYSAASYCFGSNINMRYLLLQQERMGLEKISDEIKKAREDARSFNENVARLDINTITDLQTVLIVRERIVEALDMLKNGDEAIAKAGENASDAALYSLAYAIERLNSAKLWHMYYGTGKESIRLNENNLRISCINKIAEVEERLSYVRLIFPLQLSSIQEGIKEARQYRENGESEFCLFKASKVKAELDAIIWGAGLEQERYNSSIKKKLNVARRSIIKQYDAGIFPILAYSYYEYADSLRHDRPYSAMVYSEYALEFSNIDIYFKEPGKTSKLSVSLHSMLLFVYGVLIGFSLGLIVQIRKRKRRENSLVINIKR